MWNITQKNYSMVPLSLSYQFLFILSQVIKVDHDAHGVDTPEDVEKIESLMRERNIS